MPLNPLIFDECVKNGYSKEDGGRVWNIASYSLLHDHSNVLRNYLALKQVPRYKTVLVDTEMQLIENYASKLASYVTKSFNLIDFACGDGTKALALLKSAKLDHSFRYCPVHVTSLLTDLAVKQIEKAKLKTHADTKALVASFADPGEVVGMLRTGQYQQNVIFLHGSVLASFEIHDFLFELSNDMLPGDVIVIGNGIRSGERFANLDTYKHPAFNQWFMHLPEGLGFEAKEIEYDVRFANGRLEGFYRVLTDKEVVHKGKRLKFKQGDTLLVGFQYKYFAEELEKICKMYFSNIEIVKDASSEYALIFCKK